MKPIWPCSDGAMTTTTMMMMMRLWGRQEKVNDELGEIQPNPYRTGLLARRPLTLRLEVLSGRQMIGWLASVGEIVRMIYP